MKMSMSVQLLLLGVTTLIAVFTSVNAAVVITLKPRASENQNLAISQPAGSSVKLLNVRSGQPFVLMCTVTGEETPDALGQSLDSSSPWRVNGVVFAMSNANVEYQTTTTRRTYYFLTVNSATIGGRYECSSGSNDDEINVYIIATTTQPAPTTTTTTTATTTKNPVLVSALNLNENGEIVADELSEAMLQCRCTSNPKADEGDIKWYKADKSSGPYNETEAGRVEYFQLFDSTIVLSRFTISAVSDSDSGFYKCEFTTLSGTASAEIKLRVVSETDGNDNSADQKSIKDVLRISRAVPLGSTSVQVDWQAGPEKYTATSYTVRIRADSVYYTEQTTSPTQRSVVFTGLQPSTVYEVTVQANTDAGAGEISTPMSVQTEDDYSGCKTIKPKRTDLSDLGSPCLFRGWVDVQGQGANNDYCRVISDSGQQYLSCALAGSSDDHVYTSPNNTFDWFDAGHTDTWYMKDQNGDGKDDYCRCVGIPPNTVVSCMQAGDEGFVSHDDFQIQGSAGCHYTKVNQFFGEPY